MSNIEKMGVTIQGGILDFENYWGEKLASVTITHYVNDIINISGKEKYTSINHIVNIYDKATVSNALRFDYALGNAFLLDFWEVRIETESNEVYSTEIGLRCSIEDKDNGKVILGVNGESKKMYVSMASGNCSAYLLRES